MHDCMSSHESGNVQCEPSPVVSLDSSPAEMKVPYTQNTFCCHEVCLKIQYTPCIFAEVGSKGEYPTPAVVICSLPP